MKITISINKDEARHLKDNFECAYDTCEYFKKILEKCKQSVLREISHKQRKEKLE